MKNAEVTETDILMNGIPIYGLVLVRVLCPQHLLYPFLMLRDSKSGKVSIPVCRFCSENEQIELCQHSMR